MYKISSFIIKTLSSDGSVIYKSTQTGAVAKLSQSQENSLTNWLHSQDKPSPDFIDRLCGINKILINKEINEFNEYQNELLDTRNNRACIFTLHFEPTMQCQLECNYCFENGIDRGKAMTNEIFDQSILWLNQYLNNHPEIKVLRIIFFGGEPLLRSDIMKKAIIAFSQLSQKYGLEYTTEIITNGELLTEDIAFFFSKYNWKRVQITLDGPANIHDIRRHGKNNRPTFSRIWNNIIILAKSNYIPVIDVRLSLDYLTVEYLPELLELIAQTGIQNKIRLSIGFTESSFFITLIDIGEIWQANQALKIWKIARDLGFKIPDEYSTGPLCIAQAKHSAVLQPDGKLQKCFCTSGQSCHSFGDIFLDTNNYTQDPRYENFKRINDCVYEKCPYIPICGGGCTYQAVVENGNTKESFSNRRCQKSLIKNLNEGLLKLSY